MRQLFLGLVLFYISCFFVLRLYVDAKVQPKSMQHQLYWHTWPMKRILIVWVLVFVHFFPIIFILHTFVENETSQFFKSHE